MKYTQVKNPKWANFEKTVIQCEVNFDDVIDEFVPFGAIASGDYPHTHEIFERCVSGEFGDVQDYDGPLPPTEEELLEQKKAEVRRQRDEKLKELDYVVSNPLRFASFTDEQKAELATYRQALLDIPQQSGFPVEVAWPVRPEFI